MVYMGEGPNTTTYIGVTIGYTYLAKVLVGVFVGVTVVSFTAVAGKLLLSGKQ